jgi:4-carboxymuconolactone decarboxylase
MTERSELYKKGEAIRRKLRGDAEYEKNMKEYAADPHTQKFIDLATETVFGALWARPTLDLKLRSLICVITDATMGRHDELDIHLRFALKQGWTEDELIEVMLHMSGYIGVPLIREAMYCAKDVFADERAKKAAAAKG